ncbi:MAG: hypothetical protein ACYS0K_13610 [Planctomycetota bacterium]|jgi:hypothetical protein
MVERALLLLGLFATAAAPQGNPSPSWAFDWVPWARTVEEARERAKRERRLVLAFVVPWDGKTYEAGYDGAERVHPPGSTPADAERQRTRDPGYVKELAILTTLLGNPDLAALISRRCVPVRVRMHTWHFFDGGRGPFDDPLPRLGTSERETRPPAIVFATAEGKLLHRIERMGVFSPYLVHRTLLALLARHPKYKASHLPSAKLPFRELVTQLIDGGNFVRARKRLAKPPDGDADWAVLAAARMDALEGKLDQAEAALRALARSKESDTLLGEILIRRRRCAEAVDVLDPTAVRARVHLAYAKERLTKQEEARALWESVLEEAPQGPLAARARLRLASQGPLAREWETLADLGAPALIETTIAGQGDDAAAVRYLLDQQAPDGSWKDARGGPGDLSVPRTALCVGALRAWRSSVEDPRIDDAIRRGTAYVTGWKPRETVWDLTYALHLELDLHAQKASPEDRQRIEALLAALKRTEHDGGWTYTRPPRRHTFNTAPILILLARARELGLPADEELMARAARFLEQNRIRKQSVFHYGTTMEHMTDEKGAKGEKSTCLRSPLCELALHVAGFEKGTKRLSRALGLFFKYHESARATQKIFESYVDVTNMQDSYRYFFGVYYAASAIRRLPPAKGKKLARKLADAIRRNQELDGSYVDSQMIGKPSSTALALLALAELRAALA